MSRQIKFRAYNHTDKKMYRVRGFSYYNIDAQALYDVTLEDEDEVSSWMVASPRQFSLLQFTGLQDKAGRDIYEGDILRLDTVIEACLLFDTPERHLRALFKVVYKDDYAGFDVEEIEDPEEEPVGGWSLIKDCQEDWEIVGNVYETPELLTNLPTQSNG